MFAQAVAEKITNAWRAFRSARGGNVAITFAIATIPMVGMVGAAVDYSRANSARTSMQGAVDSLALMLSKDAQSLSDARLDEKADNYFRALFTRTDVKSIVLTPTLTSPSEGRFHLDVVATGKVDATFARVLGQTEISIDTRSQVVWGMKKLELALALDNTGSMSSHNKMTELKRAAKSLIETLERTRVRAGDIKVAIIPFTTDVNVGKDNVNADWLEWSEWEDENGDDVRNGRCGGGRRGRARRCSGSSHWVPDNHNKWNGCVMDREQDYDTLDTTPTTTIKGTLFPPNQAGDCPVAIQPLTSNWGKLTSVIESMKPDGNTNVTIGLAWAWHALTPNSPLTEATLPSTDLDKVIILLTDGQNTENRWSSSQTEIDARTRRACANVKAANIKLYTIRVIDGNDRLLQDCASKSDMFYNVEDAAQLNAVFTAIAQNLASLHIAK